MRKLAVLTLVAITATAPPVVGDGLLYELPKDGTGVRYEMEVTDHGAGTSHRTQIMVRSVGRVAGNEPARWLEFDVPHEDEREIVKVLIPESRLKAGESPLDHYVRGWSKLGEETPRSMARARNFWLLILLAGPLRDEAKLEKVAVKTPLGELACDGLTGTNQVREEDGYSEDLKYTIRRHRELPFGVARCRIDCRVSFEGKPRGSVTYDLKLTEIVTDAKSALVGYE